MSPHLPLLKDADVRGKRVLLRLNLDLPVENDILVDTYRIDSAGKTLAFLRDHKARTLIIGHVGRDPQESLRPIFEYLKKNFPVSFVSTLEEAKEAMASLQEGSFLLLENLRSFSGETKNAPVFTRELASLGDIYVNEAFAVSHREHTSIVGIPTLLPCYAGFVFADEVEHLSKAFSPEHPMLVVLGGAKFETKTPLIEKFLPIADDIYVCGALANDIYCARGYETGVSLVSECAISPRLLENQKMHVPSDVIARKLSGSFAKNADAVERDEKIVDAGPNALDNIRALVEKAKFVLWNGPLGEYEAGFEQGTIELAQALAECDAETIIGGGDSLAVVSKLGLLERFSFVSTGGGAMLEFLANGTLPGIEALRSPSVIPA
ncbi:MAG: Phosphoglycerate kinase [Parcubacteria group bacterium GW2011_GWA2_49_9]|nr:MAG: Phosphoglycerate kinase [Parcubacteria group bacterium GW2011_GWA2_49_9]